MTMVSVDIGGNKVQAELTTMFVSELVVDVPVRENHVHGLMESMRLRGQVMPISFWKEGQKIIDGAHRAEALKRLGTEKAIVAVYSCNEETFWELRILAAVAHEAVAFARIVPWINAAFTNTEWAQKMRVEDAFQVGKRGAGIKVALVPDERRELTNWVQQKAKAWDLPAQRISRMLRIAHMVDPILIPQVRDEKTPGTISQSVIEQIGRKIKRFDIQQAIILKVKTEKLSLKDVQELVDQVAKATTESQRRKLVYVPLHKAAKGRPSHHATVELQKVYQSIVGDALKQITEFMPNLQQPQAFDDNAVNVLAVIACYLGREDTTVLETLQCENQTLKRDIQKLKSDFDIKKQESERQRFRIQQLEEELARCR